MSTAWQRKIQLSPALVSLLTVLVAAQIYGALWLAGWSSEPDGIVSAGYALWAGVATISFVLWVAVFMSGLGRLALPCDRQKQLERPGGWWARTIGIYAALAVAASLLILAITRAIGMSTIQTTAVPPSFSVIILVLMAVGWIAAAPWIMLVWTTDDELRALRGFVEQLHRPAATDDYDPRSVDGDSLNDIADRMAKIWTGIEGPSLALGVVLSTLVLNTGTLRLVELAADREPETFPPYYVLGYGAFFALVAVAIIAPLIFAWRSLGTEVVRTALPGPLSGIPSEEQVSAADRLSARL